MRFSLLLFLVMSLFVVSCADEAPGLAGSRLTVTDGTLERTYTVEDLASMENSRANFREVSYVGVKLSTLLRHAGIDPESVSAVKATAEDGFTANYDSGLVNKDDTIVAFARVDGALAEDDGLFRMVLPDQEGKLNPRHLVEIRVFQ